MFRIWQIAAIIYAIPLILTGCSGDGEDFLFNPVAPASRPLSDVPPSQRFDFYANAPAVTIDVTKTYTAIIHTRRGDIVVALDAQWPPESVKEYSSGQSAWLAIRRVTSSSAEACPLSR